VQRCDILHCTYTMLLVLTPPPFIQSPPLPFFSSCLLLSPHFSFLPSYLLFFSLYSSYLFTCFTHQLHLFINPSLTGGSGQTPLYAVPMTAVHVISVLLLPPLRSTALHCTVLYCSVLYYILYYTVLYCTVLYYTVL
jgi:hypothetical protein